MKNLCDILLQEPFAEMAQELLKNDKFQGRLKKFLGEISKPKGSMMLKTLWHFLCPNSLHASFRVACRHITQVAILF